MSTESAGGTGDVDRTWVSGHDHITVSKVVKHILEAAGKPDAEKHITGLVGLTGQVAFENDVREGRKSQPSVNAVKRAHQEGFENGWNAAMDVRDVTDGPQEWRYEDR